MNPPRRTSSTIPRSELIAMIGALRGQLYDYLRLIDLRAEDDDGNPEDKAMKAEAQRIANATTFDVDDVDVGTRAEKDAALGYNTRRTTWHPVRSAAAMAVLMEDVRAFHRAAQRPHPDHLDQEVSAREIALRIRLINEEVDKELMHHLDAACASRAWREPISTAHWCGIADGLADAIYVEVGSAVSMGIPLDRVWAEVQRANMDKIDPKTGACVVRKDGKVLKPEGWREPNIAGALGLPPEEETT